jgi:hypothetical protein
MREDRRGDIDDGGRTVMRRSHETLSLDNQEWRLFVDAEPAMLPIPEPVGLAGERPCRKAQSRHAEAVPGLIIRGERYV